MFSRVTVGCKTFNRISKVQRSIRSCLLLKKLHGNCSVIVVLPQSTGRVDVPGVSVFYGAQPLKELLGVLEIDA